MIKVELLITVHELLIEKYGGIQGIRDSKGLDSAITRPFMTFDQQELYPTPVSKAAALIESLICNHPFLDGNKRIGYVMMRFFLLKNKLDIKATQSEKYDFVIKIANGQIQFDQILAWIEENVKDV
ncbi:MAG: type II toxin-antitoxin system death-on-curing family toxin [Bacteroidetes bacterium]|nr:type II toxin-antitoxin system death-on-curing family toxin [Bacteroidota bacterium]